VGILLMELKLYTSDMITFKDEKEDDSLFEVIADQDKLSEHLCEHALWNSFLESFADQAKHIFNNETMSEYIKRFDHITERQKMDLIENIKYCIDDWASRYNLDPDMFSKHNIISVNKMTKDNAS
jgi:hypothetical protein